MSKRHYYSIKPWFEPITISQTHAIEPTAKSSKLPDYSLNDMFELQPITLLRVLQQLGRVSKLVQYSDTMLQFVIPGGSLNDFIGIEIMTRDVQRYLSVASANSNFESETLIRSIQRSSHYGCLNSVVKVNYYKMKGI